MKKSAVRIFILLFIALLSYTQIYGQESGRKITLGVESEIMTFINRGYHGSFWIGINGFRSRFVYARATYPSSLSPEGFGDLSSVFYEVEVDMFLGKRRKEYLGLWYALGLGLTKQSVKSESTGLKGRIDLFDLHTGIGYAIPLYKGLYINPWVGLDLHLNARNVQVGDEIWKPHFVDPVGGAKIGYRF